MTTYDPKRNNPLLAKGLASLSGTPTASSSTQSLGWAENIGNGSDASALLKRADVLADIRQFYKNRDGFNPSDDDALIKRFYADRTISNINTVGLSRDLNDAYSMSDEQAARLARVQKLYDALPNFYEEGGRGIKGLAQNVGYGLIDPLNAIGGFVGGKAGSTVLRETARQAITQAGTKSLSKAARSQVVRRAVMSGALAGAKVEAATEGGVSAVQSVLSQSRNSEIGLQDGVSMSQLMQDTAFGAATGAGFGSVFGAGGALYGGKISRAASKVHSDVFGNFTNKYTSSDKNIPPSGVSEGVDAAAVGTQATVKDKNDAKVTQYISSQRDQYKRNLDATVDAIRGESGEKALAEWRTGKLAEDKKTPAMKQADDLQAGRTALEDLYKWPNMRSSLERQLEGLTTIEQPKPDIIAKINEFNDKINRGDDAYEAIVRASGDGMEADFDKVVADYARFITNTEAGILDPESGTQFNMNGQVIPGQMVAQPAAPKAREADTFAPAFNDEAPLASADESAIGTEINKLEAAKEAGSVIDAAYETNLKSRYKELTGQDFVSELPDVDVVEDVSVDLPETAADAQEALSGLRKSYNNITNKMARLRTAIENGTATPAQVDKLASLTAEREKISTDTKQMKDRLDALSQRTEEPVVAGVIRTAEAEAADSPLDVDGVSGYLSEYGFPAEMIKREMADFLRTNVAKSQGGAVSKDFRTKLVRQFVTEKIQYARSLAHLEGSMERNTEAVAFIPDAMRKLIQIDPAIPADMKASTLSRYEEWLEFNSSNILSKYMAENPELPLDDVVSLIAENHGSSMADLISKTLGADDGDAIVQYMSARSTPGWDKLTQNQRDGITKKIDLARERLTARLGQGNVSDKKINGLIEMQKQNMVLEALYSDFAKSVRTSSMSLGDSYPVIVDPETKSSVSGKVWQHGKYTKDEQGNITGFEKQASVSGSDKFGLQAMLRQATGGRASSVDEYGNLVIDYPFFGSLLVRDIVRSPDGSIDFAKTTDGKYVTKQLPDGTTINIPRKYSAAESARREMERAQLDNATNRIARVENDVANLKAGQKGVTQKQLKAAEIEASRTSASRSELNKRTTGNDIDATAEQLNKDLRASVRKVVIKDAVRNAIETAPDAPDRALAENIGDAQQYLGEEIPLEEIENSWNAVEGEVRSINTEAVRKKLVAEAVSNFRLHNDNDTLVADLNRINGMFSEKATKPKAHSDKPAGVRREPRMYVYKGWEVDVRNNFDYKKTSENTHSIEFMGEKVGDLKTNADGSAVLLYTDADGLEASVKASSLDQMAGHLPRIFGDRVLAAGDAGKLTKSSDQATDAVYPIDWKASSTWSSQKRLVPVETVVETPVKVTGQVADWKANPDVSAINLDIPDGHIMAVHILEGDFKGVTRVENPTSKTPQSIGSILGSQKTKAYTVGYVPEGTKSGARDATRLFKQLDAADDVYRAGAPEAASARGKTPTVEQDDIGQIKLDAVAKIPVDQNDLPLQFRDKGLNTLAKVHDLITSMENVPWARIQSTEQYATFVQDISDLYEVRTKYAPKGIKMPTASRIQAMSQWNRVLSSYDGTSISTGIDILRRLSFMDRDLPVIGQKDMGENAGGYVLPSAGAEEANKILLNPSAFNPDGTGSVIPQPVALLHEVGHWAYMNVLTDADRMEFWKSIGKYFVNGELDMVSIRSRLPGVVPEAEQMSPAEFFANQFTQWGITQGKVNNIPMWTKMARKIVQIAEAFGVRINGDRAVASENLVDLDQDMVELFTKILPETDPMYDRYVGLHKTLDDIRKLKNDSHSRTASLAAKVLVDFDDLRRKLDSAIQTSNPMDLENALDEVSREIYGKVGGKAGAFKHTPKKGSPGTGQNRLRLFDGKVGDKKFGQTARARQALMKAHYEWREFQRELYSETRGDALKRINELNTEAVSNDTGSGDMNSSFEEMANLAYTTMDDDLVSALNFHANNLINAIAVGQDEARRIITHTGELEGQNIRVFKDGTFQGFTPSAFQQVHRSRASRRAAAEQQRVASALDEVMADIDKPVVDDRDHFPAVTPDATIGSIPVSSMNSAALAAEYKSLAGIKNSRKKDLELEIKGRINSMPDVKIKPIDPIYEDIPVRALERDLFQSIKRGKFDDMKAIANAIAWKKRHNLSEGIVTTNSPKVRKAAKIVQVHNELGASDNGVPLSAPIQIRETIKNITNRTRTDEASARMVAHRLTAILGKGASNDGPDGVITRADLSKILGRDLDGDETPVAENDQIFNSFRTEMREIAKDVRSQAGQINAVQKISRMAINALVDADELAKLGTTPDELASAFTAVMRQRGSIDQIFDGLPESSRTRINDLLKENMATTALVMRGFLSGAAKQEMQPMMMFGDLLSAVGERSTYRAVARSTGFRGMHPHLAESFRTEFVKNTTSARRASIETYSTRPIDESVMFFDGNGAVSFELLEARGNLSAPVIDGDFGSGVYLSNKAVDLDADTLPNEDIRWASKHITSLRDRLNREMANLEAIRSSGGDADDFLNEVIKPLSKRLENAVGTEAGLWRMARATKNLDAQPKVIPFIPRAKNSFDFSDTEYTFGTESPSSIDWLLSTLEGRNLIDPNDADALRKSVTTFTGREAYDSLARAVAKNGDSEQLSASNQLNDVLKDLGFDSINTGSGLMVFDANNVRHIDDNNFALDDYLAAGLSSDAQAVPLTGRLAEAAMDGDVDRKDTSGLIMAMQNMRAPSLVVEPVKKMFQRKTLTTADIQKVSWFTKMAGENGARIRQSGAHWLADKVKPVGGAGFYEKFDAEQAKAIMVSKDERGRPQNLFTTLRNLPGVKGTFGKRWVERNKFWGTVPQPHEYQVIVTALRGGDEYVAKLPPALRSAAQDVQKFFREQLTAAWKDGLPIGYKKNYFSQVWNADAIKEDPNAFVGFFKDFFLREMRRGEVPTPTTRSPDAVAEQKALALMRTLTEEGSDGVLLPDNALRQRLEDPFYERVINLKPEDLQIAERFLVNDLEGIISKYANQITRRRLLTKEFGVGNHAVSTYMNILANGKDAVVDALRNTKSFTKERRAADATIDTRVTETSEIISPVSGSEEEIAGIVDTAIQILGPSPAQWRKNKEKVRNYLMNIQEPDIVARQPEYAKRIDAIVNALSEYGGNPSGIDPSEITAMVQTVSGISGKPMDTPNPALIKWSRGLRTFNSITLLPFTTLASIPDLGMGMIRSGSPSAAFKGWKQYLSDPHYREMAKNIGVGVEGVLHERMSHMYNDTSSRMTNSFFNFNFLNQWTNIQREVSALIGMESFRAEAKRAQDLASRGMTNGHAYRTAYRYLQRYGLEKYAQPGASNLSNPDEMINNDALRYAVMRFTNEAIFSPNPNDVPLWAQGPVGALVFQLKSYPLMMGRMSKYVINEAFGSTDGKANANFGPLMCLFASGGVLGATSLAVRDVVQRRGEDTDGDGIPDKMFRDRYATDNAATLVNMINAIGGSVGLEVEAGSNADAILGWLVESMLVAGGFGLFADLMHTAIEQGDNQDYGTMRMMGAILGPTFSTAADLTDITMTGIQQITNEDPSNSDQRDAVRKLVGRTPFLGSVRGVREGVVNAVAGESEARSSGGSNNKLLF